MNRWAAVIVAAVLASAAACSSDSRSTPSPPPSLLPTPTVSPTPTPTPTPTESASVSAAKRVYLAFRASSAAALRSPESANLGELKKLAIDQAFGEIQAALISFQVNDIAFRGNPPSQRLKVVSDRPSAKPYPTVELEDCPTVSITWKPYVLRTNKPAKTVPGKALPPYPTAVTVIFLEGRWTVQRTATDRAVTCSP